MKFVERSNIFACFKLQNFVSRIIKKYKILCFLCIIVCGLVLAFRENKIFVLDWNAVCFRRSKF